MKNVLNLVFIFILSVLVVSCASTNSTSSRTAKPEKEKYDRNDYSRYNNLAEILRTKGLEVTGSGSNVNVRIRGISSINLNTQPLYVLDNVPLGNSYSMANNAVNTQNIASVRVIKDTSQLTKWGEPGTNGVILIKSKTKDQSGN